MRKLKIEKKYIPLIIMAVACVVMAVLCGIKAVDDIKYNEKLISSSLIDTANTFLIADGGNGTEIPKNTKFAVDDLMTKSFSAIKIDARLTKDKKWVSLQSEDISTVTDGKGNVKDINYYDLLNHNIKNFRPQEFPVIELVESTAKYAYENSIFPVIFFHDYSKSAVKNLLGKLSNDGTRVLYFASDDIRVLEYIRKLNSDASLLYYVSEINDEALEKCKSDGNMTLCFDAEREKKISVKIEKMTSENISFMCHGAEALSDIEKLYKLGVRHFITDTVAVE